jgi:hypothetical protein
MILGCVFVRFLADNRLIPTPLLSGPGERRQRALDEHELYFQQPERRAHSDRDYLLHVFEQVRGFPAADGLLHGRRFLTVADGLSAGGGKSGELEIGSGADQLADRLGIGHAFFAEDLDALNRHRAHAPARRLLQGNFGGPSRRKYALLAA